MAKPKKPIVPPPRDDDDDDLLPDVPVPPAPRKPPGRAEAEVDQDDDGVAEFEAVLAELGGASDASISVNKVTLQGEERLGKFMPREFDVDSLRDRYGGGTYWIYFHLAGKIKTKRRVVFAKTLDEVRGNDPAARAPAAAPGGDSLLQAIDRLAQLQRDQMLEMMKLMMANRPAQSDMKDVFEMASKLANLGKRDSGTDDLERLMRLAKFAREFGGGGEEGGGSGLGAVAIELFRALRENGAAQPQPQLAAPGQQPTEIQQMMIFVRRAIAQHMPTLLRGAQAESDPGVYAQLVLDQVPDLYIGSLLEQLRKTDWFALLVQVDARAAAHQPWLEALRNEILAATSPESPPSP